MLGLKKCESGTSEDLNYLVFGNKKYVAISKDSNTVLTSQNGEKWDKKEFDFPYCGESLMCFGQDKFVLIDLSYSSIEKSKWVYSSIDGKEWKKESKIDGFCVDICYGNNQFLAITKQGLLFKSLDLKSWEKIDLSNYDVTFTKIKYLKNKFYICTKEGFLIQGDDFKITSLCTNVNQDSDPINDIVYTNGKFVLVCSKYIYTSYDSQNWKYKNKNKYFDFKKICYGNGKFVIIDEFKGVYSYNLEKNEIKKIEEKEFVNPSNDFLTVDFVNNKFVVIMAKYSGEIYISYSDNGEEWMSKELYKNNGSFVETLSVKHGNNTILITFLNQFNIGIIKNEKFEKIYPCKLAFPYDLCYGNGKFLVRHKEDYISSSYDGENWEKISIPFEGYKISCLNFCNGFFLCGLYNEEHPSDMCLISSYDGEHWEKKTLNSNFRQGRITKICYSQYHTFLTLTMYSNDTILYYYDDLRFPKTIDVRNNEYYNVFFKNNIYTLASIDGGFIYNCKQYSFELFNEIESKGVITDFYFGNDKFYYCFNETKEDNNGNKKYINSIAYSSNGKDWEEERGVFDNKINQICYAQDKFVFVGNNGAIYVNYEKPINNLNIPSFLTHNAGQEIENGNVVNIEWEKTQNDNMQPYYELGFFNGENWEKIFENSTFNHFSHKIDVFKSIINAKYRVRAFDGQRYSGYRISKEFKIKYQSSFILNVEGLDEHKKNLFEDPLKFSLSVDDKNLNDKIDVSIKLNGVIIDRIIEAERNKKYTIDLFDYWKFIESEQGKTNTIEITANDGRDFVVKRFGFEKIPKDEEFDSPNVLFISGKDEDLGEFENPFEVKYFVDSSNKSYPLMIEEWVERLQFPLPPELEPRMLPSVFLKQSLPPIKPMELPPPPLLNIPMNPNFEPINVIQNAIRNYTYTLDLKKIWDFIPYGENFITIKLITPEDLNPPPPNTRLKIREIIREYKFTKKEKLESILNPSFIYIQPQSNLNIDDVVHISWGQPLKKPDTFEDFLYDLDFYDGEEWISVYRKEKRLSGIHFIPNMKDTKKAKYRVRANLGIRISEYVETKEFYIFNNHRPEISGNDSFLGNKEEPFEISYTINDEDSNDKLNSMIFLDGAIVEKNHQVINGKEYKFNLFDKWKYLAYGMHVIEIVAQDEISSSSRFYNFIKPRNYFEIHDIDYGTQVIKPNYIYPKPILYKYRGMPENVLVSRDFNTAKDIVLKTQMNEVSTLSFTIPFTSERKIQMEDCEKLIKFEGEYYIIKSIDGQNDSISDMKVNCVHESNELKGVYCTCIDLIGATPKQMFDTIMSSTRHPLNTGYKWGGSDIPNDKKRHLQTESEASVYQNLIDMAKVFNGWLEFSTDANENVWVFLRTKPINNGKYIKKNIDMKSLNIKYNSEEIFTRLEAFGDADPLTGEELNIMEVNPTKQSYVSNYSWYLNMGIPQSVIDKEAKYQQLKVLRDDTYVRAEDLYQFALEELEKYCVPQLEATVTMRDLSVYLDSLDEPPKVGYEMNCIDQEIKFAFSCKITGVERNYENPLETKVDIANVVRYDTVFQNINHGAEAGNSVTSNDGNGGTYVPEDKIKDGSHINLTYKLGNLNTKITENEKEITLTAEDLKKTKGELSVQADRITQTVKRVDGAEAEIKVQADEISHRVKDNEFGSYIIQNATKVKSAWNHNNKYAQLDDDKGLILGDPDEGTYSKVGYDGKLELVTKGRGKPYHCLTASGSVTIKCNNEDDYTTGYDHLPSYFNDIKDEDISLSVGIKKVYRDGSCIPFWFGAYGEITNGKVKIEAMSAWMPWEGGSIKNGNIIVSWTAIA